METKFYKELAEIEFQPIENEKELDTQELPEYPNWLFFKMLEESEDPGYMYIMLCTYEGDKCEVWLGYDDHEWQDSIYTAYNDKSDYRLGFSDQFERISSDLPNFLKRFLLLDQAT